MSNAQQFARDMMAAKDKLQAEMAQRVLAHLINTHDLQKISLLCRDPVILNELNHWWDTHQREENARLAKERKDIELEVARLTNVAAIAQADLNKALKKQKALS